MTIIEMLGQSGILSVLGMSVVFGFLIIMIIAITLVGKVIHALGVDKDAMPATNATAQVTAQVTAPVTAPANDASVTAAISVAVNEYRKK